MELVIDDHLKAVLEFMQVNVPAEKCVGVADALPQMARLLWGIIPQEPVIASLLRPAKPIIAEGENRSQLASIGSVPDPTCVDGDSAEAVACR